MQHTMEVLKGKQSLKFLIGTSAFHNFLSLHEAKCMCLPVYLGGVGSIKLANGDKLPCSSFVRCLVSFRMI